MIAAIKITHSSFVQTKTNFFHKLGSTCYRWNTHRLHNKDWVGNLYIDNPKNN